MRRSTAVIVFYVGLLLAGRGLAAEEPKLSQRWLYLASNLLVAENVDNAEKLLARAGAAGYNGVVLADYTLNILDRMPARYFRNVERFQGAAQKHGLEVIPCVGAFGYSEGILAHNPNLAEGLPVKDAPLIVHGDTAQIDNADKGLLPGGSFDEGRNHKASGWNYQDGPGKTSFLDTEVKHGGASSLRFENLAAGAEGSNGRVIKLVGLKPWRQYHASVWIKTDRFDTASEVKIQAIGTNHRSLIHSNLGVRPTQDWTEHQAVFNTLDCDQVNMYAGAWGGKSGKLWLDDFRLEEIAFVNLLRRQACPVVVTDADGKTLVEGKDFAELRDPKAGTTPYAGSFDVFHQPPTLKLLPGSRVKDGDRLKVSYYHTCTVHDNQVCCCLADPEVFKIFEDQVRRIDKAFSPQRYFLEYDEIRVANWCPACQQAGRSAGQLLADNVRRCCAIMRTVHSDAKLCVWSDMFDPHHNAHDNYYLVNGNWAGSWEGLPADVLVVNWNSQKAKDGLPWFAGRGNHKVLAGYYDHDPAQIVDWLHQGANQPGIDGAMYTTWRQDFSKLEAFAEAAWGKRP